MIVLVVALVLIYGLPALNAAIPWHNEIRAGDVLDLGGGATAVPPSGWQLEDGTLTGGAETSRVEHARRELLRLRDRH